MDPDLTCDTDLRLKRDGFAVLPRVVSSLEAESIAGEIEDAFRQEAGGAIETARGNLVGGRNLMAVWNGWRRITEAPPVSQLVNDHLGAAAGLVRILYFDKPPGQSWSLSLHRDRTIAVEQHHDPPAPFAKPTRKAGVPHVEASQSLLESMLTLRLHIDPMCEENGPLVVMPGSHDVQADEQQIKPIHCDAGDLFVMKPLLLHGSRASSPKTSMHRRVVHLEIAPSEELPGPYRWNRFEAIFG